MQLPIPTPDNFVLAALNALLQRETWAQKELANYAGKTVLFKLAGKSVLQATIDENGSLLLSTSDFEPHVVLNLPFNDLPGLITSFREYGMDGIAKQMQIQGDAGLAQLIADLARNLRWDIEADLAELFGDVAAVRITDFGKSFVGGVTQTAKRVQANIQEYLQEESPLARR